MDKLFDDMNPQEKLAHVKNCLANAHKEYLAESMIPLADIVDTWDYWAPWLIARIEKLEAALKYYANEERYIDQTCYLMVDDRGKKAREALKDE